MLMPESLSLLSFRQYVRYGSKLYGQIVSIPIGINYAPLLFVRSPISTKDQNIETNQNYIDAP